MSACVLHVCEPQSHPPHLGTDSQPGPRQQQHPLRREYIGSWFSVAVVIFSIIIIDEYVLELFSRCIINSIVQ